MQWRSLPVSRTLLCAVLTTGIAITGCLAQRASQLRRRLVGAPAAEIERCLGTPSTLEALDGRAVWLYEAMYSGPLEQATIEIAQGSGAVPLPPHVIAGPAATEAQLGAEEGTPSAEPVARVTCVLVFELESGVVRRFRSAGRGPRGSNAASECALLARDCATDEPVAEEPR